MKKSLFSICIRASLLALLTGTSAFAAKEVTICYAQNDCNARISVPMIGENKKLCGGQCAGEKTIVDMYKEGWQLNTFLGELSDSFGLIFERDIKIKK